MSRIVFDDNLRLLREFVGDELIFTWDYSIFEEYVGEAITPSMYHFMANFVRENKHVYGDDTESMAVDAYFDLPKDIRQAMHEQELVNLQSAKDEVESKELAAIDAILDENSPFDNTSPIAHEYVEFLRSVISKNQKLSRRLENEIYEEEQLVI